MKSTNEATITQQIPILHTIYFIILVCPEKIKDFLKLDLASFLKDLGYIMINNESLGVQIEVKISHYESHVKIGLQAANWEFIEISTPKPQWHHGNNYDHMERNVPCPLCVSSGLC